MKESGIQRKVIVELQKAGAAVCKMEAVGRRGWPDIVAVLDGKTFFIETKTDKGRLSNVQKQVHRLIWKNGGCVHTVYGEGYLEFKVNLQGR